MAKLIIKNRHGVAPDELLNNPEISLKAKGLFTYLQSKPDNWKFSKERIACQNKDGKDGIKSALQELEKWGYLKRIPTKDKEGKWDGYDYILTEKPSAENPSTEKPSTEKGAAFSKIDNSKKDLVKKKKKVDKSTTAKQWGNPDVNELISLLKERFGLRILDGTEKENRRYCYLAIKKFKKEGVKLIIEAGARDEFWRNKITGFKTLYYNGVKIASTLKKPKNVIGIEDIMND